MNKTTRQDTKPNMWKKVRIIVFLLLLSALAFGYFHFMKKPPISTDTENEKIVFQKQGELFFLSSKGKLISRIDIEIAATEYQKEKGLMARISMAENQGMLFLFDYPKIQSFWMKDTILPLDLIFTDENRRIVHIANDAVPFSETLISSEKPAQYVVEVNAGYCNKHHIEIGNKIEFIKFQEDTQE
jgi:uncharacterized protein